jgi:hypothetical protein
VLMMALSLRYAGGPSSLGTSSIAALPRFKGSSQHRLIEPIVDGR